MEVFLPCLFESTSTYFCCSTLNCHFSPSLRRLRSCFLRGVLIMIHVVCVGEDCDCLDAESWYPGVPLKDVIVAERASMSPIEREIRRRANISFKTVIRRNYIIRKSGLDYLLLVLSKELGAHSFQSVMKDIVHSIWVLETDEFRHYYQITGADHLRDSVVKLVIRDMRATTRFSNSQLCFTTTGPEHQCNLCINRRSPDLDSWWPYYSNSWKLPTRLGKSTPEKLELFRCIDEAIDKITAEDRLIVSSGESEFAWKLFTQYWFSSKVSSVRAARLLWPYLSLRFRGNYQVSALQREENHLANLVAKELESTYGNDYSSWGPPHWGVPAAD